MKLFSDQVSSNSVFISSKFSDRGKSIEELLHWLDANQVDHEAVEIRPVENGFGLFSTKDLEPNSIPIQLPHKLMLSLDFAPECADIKYVLGVLIC